MRRAGNDDGFVMVAAIVMLTVILGLGVGLLLFSDAQQKASAGEQASEAAFNVANAALNAQIGQLASKWPNPEIESARAAKGEEPEMPTKCISSTSTATNDCPSPTDLKLDPNTGSTSCSGTDAWGSPLSNQWTTYVRYDPGESPYFNSTSEEGEHTYPEHPETGALWVRAVGVVQCHEVAVVSLVTRLRVELGFPKDAIVGNWFKDDNSGNKTIVNRQGNASEPAPISMRCDEGKLSLSECEVVKKETQVSPPVGTEDPKSSAITLTASQLATLKAEAQAYKTFYSSTSPYKCPSSMTELQGVELSTGTRAPVYIEGCGALSFKNGEANTRTEPGFLVLANGTLEVTAKSTYYGVIYAANLENSESWVVKVHGGGRIVGGIVVDGKGGIEFGESGGKGKGKKEEEVEEAAEVGDFEFGSLALQNLTISAGAAATRNSFRILPAGQ
jgi:type II secretory pathway pseudopilin PulG